MKGAANRPPQGNPATGQGAVAGWVRTHVTLGSATLWLRPLLPNFAWLMAQPEGQTREPLSYQFQFVLCPHHGQSIRRRPRLRARSSWRHRSPQIEHSARPDHLSGWLVPSPHAGNFCLCAASSSLIFSRSRSVTTRRNREFSSWSSAIRPPPRVRSNSLAPGFVANAG